MMSRIVKNQLTGLIVNGAGDERTWQRFVPATGWLPRCIGLMVCALLLVSCSVHHDTRELPAYSELSPESARELDSRTPQAYTIVPGDVLHIQVLKRSDLQPVFDLTNLRVSELGTVYVPVAGEIHVAGLTERAMRAEVEAALSAELRKPIVNAQVTASRGKRVYILGEVTNPGVYPLDANTTVFELITIAGGQTKDADLSRIALLRSESATTENSHSSVGVTLDMEALLAKAEFRQNVTLKPGDFIYVPHDGIAHTDRYFNHLLTIVEPFTSIISAVGNIIFINREIQN